MERWVVRGETGGCVDMVLREKKDKTKGKKTKRKERKVLLLLPP